MKVSDFLKLGKQGNCNEYYQDCYVKAFPKDNPDIKNFRWVRFKGWINHNEVSMKPAKGDWWTGPAESFEWDLTFPKTRPVNYRGTVLIPCHCPARITRKGVCPESFDCWNLLFPVWKFFPEPYVSTNNFRLGAGALDMLDASDPVAEFQQRFEKLMKQQIFATVVNANISISQGLKNLNPTVWLLNRPIGEYLIDSNKVIVTKDCVMEVGDAFEYLNVKVS